jgi:fatty acid desaturase
VRQTPSVLYFSPLTSIFVDRVNHWIVLITFLQHTDPLLPHYRAGEFTFPRGALSTYDRSLLGDLGPVMAWLAATLTHGISETHVAHHVHSKIPHYHAWEATDALRVRLGEAGIKLQGRNSGWGEMYRVYKQCRVRLSSSLLRFEWFGNTHPLTRRASPVCSSLTSVPILLVRRG